MQDIDFDEIDRAVNSLTSPSSDASTKSVAADPTPVVTEPVTEVSPDPVVPAPTTPSPAARRSSGRFMDVVHPSSDMRPTVSDRPAPSAPSFHREEVAERDEPEERPESAAATSTAFHWPDPIDVAASESTAEPTPEPSVSDPTPEVIEEPSTAPELGDLIDDEDEPDNEATPLESPFLPDAKVEKRPLGAFSGADEGLPLLEDPIPFSTSPVTEPEEPQDEVEEPAHEEHETHPEELHPDLLALDGHNQDEPLLEATNPPDPTPTVDNVPSGPTSITQQYTEQASSTAETSGSIFDTDAYHLPLTHTAKKNSGVMIVVWIIALILVGGGIGAGIYFVLLPMLG